MLEKIALDKQLPSLHDFLFHPKNQYKIFSSGVDTFFLGVEPSIQDESI